MRWTTARGTVWVVSIISHLVNLVRFPPSNRHEPLGQSSLGSSDDMVRLPSFFLRRDSISW